jgi:hypothetical protein
MNHAISLVTFWLISVPAFVLLVNNSVEVRSAPTMPQSGYERCFQDSELSESLAALKLQFGPELNKVSQSLLTKARTAPRCRTQLVQALISAMEQATNSEANQYKNFFLWQHGASLLSDLKATEALDLLIANIDITDGWSASISQSNFPALAAILKIGSPAIAKLQLVLSNDSNPVRRKFAAFAIAYIGGSQARRALTKALPGETDPCVKNLVQISLQAFDNKEKPKRVSPALNGKWLSAFYCL